MDGFELARHINNSVDYYGLPIIMISSRVGDKHRQRAMDLGVKRCLGKPYQEAELLDSINEVLAETRR
jgi:chemosensory pili system protein ChpA (sensor histidine kinase/response regulator)